MNRCLYDFAEKLLFQTDKGLSGDHSFSQRRAAFIIGLPAMALVFAIAAGDGGPTARA